MWLMHSRAESLIDARYKRGLVAVLGVAASTVLLAACGAAGNEDVDSSIAASTLYRDASTPRSNLAANNLPGKGQSIVSENSDIPPGQSGELVPGIGVYLGELTPQQKLVVNTAYYLEVQKCMSSQGFKLLDPAPKLEVPHYGDVLFDGYIGILDRGYAEKYGYQLDASSLAGQDQGQRHVAGSAEYENSLKVSGGGGCDAVAVRMIEENVPSEDKSTPLLGKIYQTSLNSTYADSKFKEAVSQWSDCMSEAGFEYRNPKAAFSKYHGFEVSPGAVFGSMSPQASDSEIKTAVTDVECKRSSRLADVFRTVFWNNQVSMSDRNRPTLKVLDEIRSQKLRNSQAIIAKLS